MIQNLLIPFSVCRAVAFLTGVFTTFTALLPAQEAALKASGKQWALEVKAVGDDAIVMAVPKSDPKKSVKLCDAVSVNTTRVFLSQDDDIAVVETGSGSLGMSLSVFLLTEGTEFLELKDWNVTDAVQKAYEKATKPRKEIVRPSLHFVAWSADGQAALVRWSGGNESWFAVVDFEKRTLNSSLERMNRRPKAE
jgi:hypothetical protein